MGKRIITEADVLRALEAGQSSIAVPETECIVTPQAHDTALANDIKLITDPAAAQSCAKESTGAACPVADTANTGEEDSAAVIKEVCRLMRDRLPEEVATPQLETLVRDIVIARLSGTSDALTTNSDSECDTLCDGIRLVNCRKLLEGEGAAKVPEHMIVADAIGPASEAAKEAMLSGGYLVWEKASFSRTLEQPEITVVIEGELHLTAGGKTVIGKSGDMLYLPKGANVLYSAPDRVRLACVNNLQ